MAVRILESSYVEGRWFITAAGDSTDTKPDFEICDGSIFIETDTGSVSFYNETAADWIPVGSSGGD